MTVQLPSLACMVVCMGVCTVCLCGCMEKMISDGYNRILQLTDKALKNKYKSPCTNLFQWYLTSPEETSTRLVTPLFRIKDWPQCNSYRFPISLSFNFKVHRNRCTTLPTQKKSWDVFSLSNYPSNWNSWSKIPKISSSWFGFHRKRFAEQTKVFFVCFIVLSLDFHLRILTFSLILREESKFGEKSHSSEGKKSES